MHRIQCWFLLPLIGLSLVLAPSEGVRAQETIDANAEVRAKSEVQLSSDLPQMSGSEIAMGTLLAPKAVRQAVGNALASLVTIESFGGVTAVEGKIGGIRRQGEGNSTGVLLENGMIVTSTFNFVRNPSVITVVTSDGKRHVAQLVGRDDSRKICLLRIEAPPDVECLDMVSTDEIEIGQWAISLGVGYGDKSPAVSLGIISALKRIYGRAIQTDTNISPANYGGPLLDIRGRMIGICVPLSPNSTEVASGVEWYDSGIGFAIPLDREAAWFVKLSEGESVRPPAMGFEIESTEDLKSVKVKSVKKKSAEQQAGLKEGDVVLAVDDVPIASVSDLRIQIQRHESGQEVTLKVQRDGKELEVTFELSSAPSSQPGGFESLLPTGR